MIFQIGRSRRPQSHHVVRVVQVPPVVGDIEPRDGVEDAIAGTLPWTVNTDMPGSCPARHDSLEEIRTGDRGATQHATGTSLGTYVVGVCVDDGISTWSPGRDTPKECADELRKVRRSGADANLNAHVARSVGAGQLFGDNRTPPPHGTAPQYRRVVLTEDADRHVGVAQDRNRIPRPWMGLFGTPPLEAISFGMQLALDSGSRPMLERMRHGVQIRCLPQVHELCGGERLVHSPMTGGATGARSPISSFPFSTLIR